MFSQSLKLSRQQSQIKETKFHRARDKIERNEFCVTQRKKAKRRERERERREARDHKQGRKEKKKSASKQASRFRFERERERAQVDVSGTRGSNRILSKSPHSPHFSLLVTDPNLKAACFWVCVFVLCLFCRGEKASASVAASGNGAGFEQMRRSCKWLSY